METNEKTKIKEIKEFLLEYMEDDAVEFHFNTAGVRRLNDHKEDATLADQSRLAFANIRQLIKKYS